MTGTAPKSSVILIQSSDQEEIDQITSIAFQFSFSTFVSSTLHQSLSLLKQSNNIVAVITKLGTDNKEDGLALVEAARKQDKKIFICVFSYTACDNAVIRTSCTTAGAHVVTCDMDVVKESLTMVAQFHANHGTYSCPLCSHGSMTEDELRLHYPFYHNQNQGGVTRCPVCKVKQETIAEHLFNFHGPCGRGEIMNEYQMAVKRTNTFALMVCRRRRDGKFLLVQEVLNWGWWLPGGRINCVEDLVECVKRETKEEAGIDVNVKGVLRIEYNPSNSRNARLRVIFYGEPENENQLPKTIPDFESLGGAYATTEELTKLPLRGSEPVKWFNYVEKGGTIYPLSLLTHEGADVQ